MWTGGNGGNELSFGFLQTGSKKETKTSRADVNALKVLRKELRGGILAAYTKLEPRVKDAIRERADMGAIQVQVMVDLRPAE